MLEGITRLLFPLILMGKNMLSVVRSSAFRGWI